MVAAGDVVVVVEEAGVEGGEARVVAEEDAAKQHYLIMHFVFLFLTVKMCEEECD